MAKELIYEAQETPVVQKTDILIVGGGLAGASAAVAAARLDKKVTLLEKSTVLGGLAHKPATMHWLGLHPNADNRSRSFTERPARASTAISGSPARLRSTICKRTTAATG